MRQLYERTCDSCHTYVLSTLVFFELILIKNFHSYKTYKKSSDAYQNLY